MLLPFYMSFYRFPPRCPCSKCFFMVSYPHAFLIQQVHIKMRHTDIWENFNRPSFTLICAVVVRDIPRSDIYTKLFEDSESVALVCLRCIPHFLSLTFLVCPLAIWTDWPPLTFATDCVHAATLTPPTTEFENHVERTNVAFQFGKEVQSGIPNLETNFEVAFQISKQISKWRSKFRNEFSKWRSNFETNFEVASKWRNDFRTSWNGLEIIWNELRNGAAAKVTNFEVRLFVAQFQKMLSNFVNYELRFTNFEKRSSNWQP